MKKYWFVLHQDTFLWIKETDGLIYSSSNNHLFFRFRNEGIIARMTSDLQKTSNLYRTLVTEEDLSNQYVKEWIDTIVTSSCGKLVDLDNKNEISVSLKPILKIQDTVSFYKVAHERHTDGKIIQNLLKLVIHLNGSAYGNDDIAKQLIFPKRTTETLEDIHRIKDFITSMGNPNFLIETILVGNVWEYPMYQELLQFLQTFPFKLSIYCTEEDFINRKTICGEIIIYHVLKTDYTRTPIHDDKLMHHFIVKSEEEYIKACKMIEEVGLENNYRILPLYSEKNKKFFNEFVYMDEEDICNLHLSKREVFAHQAINTNAFGTLHIDVEGNVYGDLNGKCLGVMEDGLYMLVYREMTEGNSWLRIRDQKPCCDCIYQWLCPSPSNYESVIGKPNLCHVKP